MAGRGWLCRGKEDSPLDKGYWSLLPAVGHCILGIRVSHLGVVVVVVVDAGVGCSKDDCSVRRNCYSQRFVVFLNNDSPRKAIWCGS